MIMGRNCLGNDMPSWATPQYPFMRRRVEKSGTLSARPDMLHSATAAGLEEPVG